jgi:hypothetical protein
MTAEVFPQWDAQIGYSAINSSGRAKDELLDTEVIEKRTEIDKAAEVILVVLHWVLDAFSNGCVRGKMDDACDSRKLMIPTATGTVAANKWSFIRFQYDCHSLLIREVSFMESK